VDFFNTIGQKRNPAVQQFAIALLHLIDGDLLSEAII
jgi:hypothetical protein